MNDNIENVRLNVISEIFPVYLRVQNLKRREAKLFNRIKTLSNAAQDLEEHEEYFGEELNKCPICLSDVFKSTMCTGPCNHALHIHCISEMLDRGLQACPICRGDLEPLELSTDSSKHGNPNLNSIRKTLRVLIRLHEKTTDDLQELMYTFLSLTRNLTEEEKNYISRMEKVVRDWSSG